MAITYPREWPSDIPIEKSMLKLVPNQAVFQTQFTRQTQVQQHAGGRGDIWEGVFVTPTLNADQIKSMNAWIASLRGQEKFFKAFDPDNRTAIGNDDGRINGAGQAGNTIVTDNFPNSTLVLKAGEKFTIEDHMYMALEDVTSDGVGAATIAIEPALKNSPADNAVVQLINSYFVARMSEIYEGMETNAQKVGIFSISFEEVV